MSMSKTGAIGSDTPDDDGNRSDKTPTVKSDSLQKRAAKAAAEEKTKNEQ